MSTAKLIAVRPTRVQPALLRHFDDVVEPVEDALMQQRERAHLTVRSTTLGGRESHELLLAGERLEELLGLPGGKMVLFALAHQRRASDHVRDAMHRVSRCL